MEDVKFKLANAIYEKDERYRFCRMNEATGQPIVYNRLNRAYAQIDAEKYIEWLDMLGFKIVPKDL